MVARHRAPRHGRSYPAAGQRPTVPPFSVIASWRVPARRPAAWGPAHLPHARSCRCLQGKSHASCTARHPSADGSLKPWVTSQLGSALAGINGGRERTAGEAAVRAAEADGLIRSLAGKGRCTVPADLSLFPAHRSAQFSAARAGITVVRRHVSWRARRSVTYVPF